MTRHWFKYIKSRTRLPYNILKCRLLHTYKPLVVLFYVTDRCNLSCRYCIGNWSARKIRDFTTQEIISIVDECKDLGTCHFTIHGGEILLRDDARQIVDYMKKKGFYVNLVTNGILLPDKIDDILNVDSLCISLDGREENNDFNRGKGSYKKIMDAIKLAKQKKIKFVVHAALTKRSINDIEYLARQAKEIGYYQQFSLLLKPLKNIGQQEEMGLSDGEIRAALLQIKRLKKKGYPIFTSYRALDNALNWPFPFSRSMLDKDELPGRNGLIPCFYGRLKITIDADGYVYPCSSLNDSFRALNVKEVGVKKAFEHVLENNTCSACFYLTQNDWSLLLSGSLPQFLNQAYIQLKEIFNIY